MNTYLVTYDLVKPGKDYSRLISFLEQIGSKRALLSVWAVKSLKTAKELRDILRAYADASDRLLVAEMNPTSWASWNLMTDLNKV
jgi:hypothetical protein